MKKWAALLIVIPFMSGCYSSLETRIDKSSKYAPINEKRGGIASYSTQGFRSQVEGSRKGAYKKMYEYCEGPYRITEEGNNIKGGSSVSFGRSSFYGNQRFREIRFECVDDVVKAPDAVRNH